jgi:hypothetical protein
MKRILFLLVLLCAGAAGYSQSYIFQRADSVVIEKGGGNGELIIKNAGRDSQKGGVLYNTGGGRTGFKKTVAINDSTFIVGGDTVVIKGGAKGGSALDTTSLSNRINAKLNISDTLLMLYPYLRKNDTASLSNRINQKLNISDTAAMLSIYLRKSDTVSLSSRIEQRMKYSDTASLSNRIDAKQPTGNYITGLNGDVAATGPGLANAVLAPTSVTPGTYKLATVIFDQKGRGTFAANGVVEQITDSTFRINEDTITIRGTGGSSESWVLGRNLETLDDTLKTKDTLISATPDLSENSDIVATTKWVKDQAYGTGSGSAAGSTGDVQFKGSDGLLKAAPSSNFVWDSTNNRLKIGNPSVANNRVEIEGNLNVNNGSYKIDDGNVLNINGGTELRIGEAGFIGGISIRTGGVQRVGIDNTVMLVAPPLDVATTIRIGGVEVLKDLGTELHIGAGAFWRKTRFYSNGSIVGFIDTTRWGFNNTAPQAIVHITPAGTGQYQGGLILDSTGAPTPQKYLIYNRGDHLYWYDNNLVSHQLDGSGSGSYTFSNGLTESSGAAKLGGALTQQTTLTSSTSGIGIDYTGINDYIDGPQLSVTNNGSSGVAVHGESTDGRGIEGFATSGVGVYGLATSGTALFGNATTGSALSIQTTDPSLGNAMLNGLVTGSDNNTVAPWGSYSRATGGTAAAGLGGSFDYYIQASNGTSVQAAQSVLSSTDATAASFTTKLAQYMTDNGVTYQTFTLSGKKIEFNQYGAGSNTVTPATTPVFNSSGEIGERIAPKIYTALLTQSGTGNPTATVLGTNEIGSIVWTRNSAGNYTATLSGAFTANKTWLVVQRGDQNGGFVNNILSWTSANALLLTVQDNSATPADNFTNISIEIRVYP